MKHIGIWSSPKANRIFDAARDLLLRHGARGVTMSEVARLAHVGKGTIYLYWDTKEDLIVDLFAHDFLDMVEEVMTVLGDTPAMAVPRELLPLMHRTTRRRPFLSAFQTRDYELLGYVEAHPIVRALMDTLGPGALLAQLLPVLREHGLARNDMALGSQIYGTMAVLSGFFQLSCTYPFLFDLAETNVDPDAVLAEVSDLLLEPAEMPDSAAIALAADGVLACMKRAHRAASDKLSVAAANKRKRVAPEA